jgi:hypothetical protein
MDHGRPRHGGSPISRSCLRLGVAAATALVLLALPNAAGASPRTAPYVAFPMSSWWNQRAGTTTSATSAAILSLISSYSQYPGFKGYGSTGAWGMPVYWAQDGDPEYTVTQGSCGRPMPKYWPATVRIPLGAKPNDSSDAEMAVFDLQRGYVIQSWKTAFDGSTWTAACWNIYFLDSNGIVAEAAGGDPRNEGHRGIPPSALVIRWDEIQAKLIPHKIEIVVDSTCGVQWPMVWGETPCGTAIPEGTLLRVKPGTCLSTCVAKHGLHLTGAGLTVARCLRDYGAVIGDRSASLNVGIKLEDTVAEGRGWLWNGVIGPTTLAGLPWSLFEVVQA